ncbi:hypothetical protein [Methanopyrus kandleri]
MIDISSLSWAVALGVVRGLYVFAGSFIAAVLYRYVAEERIRMTTSAFMGLLTAGFAAGPRELTALTYQNPNVEMIAWAIATLFSIPARTYGDAIGERILRARIRASMNPRTKVYRLPENPNEIKDIPGEPPAPMEVKERIAGREYEFPRGTPKEEVERVIKRDLESETGIGRAVVRVQNGDVEVLVAGAKPPVSHTLPPDKVAVSVEPLGGAIHIGEGDRVRVFVDGRELGEAEVWRRVDDRVVLVMEERTAEELLKEITQGKQVSLMAVRGEGS